MSERCYVLAREDLSPARRAVQAAHALAQLVLRHARDP